MSNCLLMLSHFGFKAALHTATLICHLSFRDTSPPPRGANLTQSRSRRNDDGTGAVETGYSEGTVLDLVDVHRYRALGLDRNRGSKLAHWLIQSVSLRRRWSHATNSHHDQTKEFDDA
jgi:hypothetical protein